MNGIEETRPNTPASTTTARPRRKADRAKASSTSRKAATAAAKANKESADARAVAILPAVLEIWAGGVRSRFELARQLNAKGIPGPRNGKWTITSLRNLMSRVGKIMTSEHTAATKRSASISTADSATESNATSRAIGPLETEKV
jgi:hypothetical protein